MNIIMLCKIITSHELLTYYW